jgi:hypothetical protein
MLKIRLTGYDTSDFGSLIIEDGKTTRRFTLAPVKSPEKESKFEALRGGCPFYCTGRCEPLYCPDHPLVYNECTEENCPILYWIKNLGLEDKKESRTELPEPDPDLRDLMMRAG